MTPRRPDTRTLEQRRTRSPAPADLLRMIARLNRGHIGSSDRDIRETYIADVQRGTNAKVLLP